MTNPSHPAAAAGAAMKPAPHEASHDEAIGAPPPPPRLRWWQLGLMGITGVAAVGGLFYLGWLPRVEQKALLAHEAEHIRTALPRVQVDQPKPSPAEQELLLPGDIEAIEETTIFPRTSGYLKKWFVDIGDEVQQGQLLAEIDTPEIDQQLRRAEANVEQLTARKQSADTQHKLAEITLRRIAGLPKGVATAQELEERQAQVDVAAYTVKVAEADVQAGIAELQRIKELQSFSKVYAPFSGTITERTIDLGQLVTSGNDQAQSLFRLARTDAVRVVVNVPQIYAPSVHPGATATLVVREMPGRTFEGKVARTARSIDPLTRTLRTEIEVNNKEGLLLTGSYVQAKLMGRRDNPPMIIPASALIFNADGTKVAVVDETDHVHLRDVEVDGDYGTQLGIANGLAATDRIVVNPGDRLTEDLLVTVETVPTQEANAKAKPKT